MELKNIRFILIFSAFVFAVLYFSTQNIKAPNISMPWQSYKNEQQQTVVFGLTINESSLEKVLRIFGGEAEMALFKNNNKYDLEVFFKYTKVGGLSGSIVIALTVGENLKFIKDNIKQSNKLPSLKGIKMLVNEYAKNKLLHLKIKNLSFIPKASLSKAIITERFGLPDSIQKEKDIEHWIYPKKGLKIILISEKQNILEYE
jgi:hypothetical protein